MPFQHGAIQRVVRLPLRRIDQLYGRDNYDNVGDDIVNCLRQVSDTRTLLSYHFTLSTDHPNPWYHTMDVFIEAMTEPAYDRLIELLAAFGLSED